MKKLTYLMTAACAVLALSSCKQDRDPVYHDAHPGSFMLYVPAMQSQYIPLQEGALLDLTTTGQPHYGYSAVAVYGAQMSLTDEFINPEEIFELTPTDVHQSDMTVKQEDVALGVCTLLGFDSVEDYNEAYPTGFPAMQLYFRATCQLEGVESSLVYSNVISYNQIQPYFAMPQPDFIYLVGDPNGWNINAGPEWRLYEPSDAIGSKVYSGVFHVEPGQYFRFYTHTGDWGNDGELPSIGSHPVDGDSSIIEWVDGSYTSPAVPGKGSWATPADWTAGDVTMVVDLSDANNYTVTFYEGSQSVVVTTYVYMVGNNGGWAEPVEGTYEDWRLADKTGSGVYSNTFDFTDFTADGGTLYCRFYQELTGWGAAQWSSDAGGANVDVTSGVAAPTFPGEGCFVIPAAGHKIEVVLDTNQDQVTFTYVD